MAKRSWLYLFLAVLGLAAGPCLGRFVTSLLDAPPKLELDFGNDCERAALSPDGHWVAGLLKRADGWAVGISDAHGGPGIAPIPVPDPPARVQTFAWDASSRWLAFGCADQVQLFDTRTGQVRALPASRLVRQVLIRGDVLLARADERVFLWSLKTGKLTFDFSISHLLQADLTADGRTLAVGCFQEGVRLVDVKSRRVLRQLAPGSVPAALCFVNKDRWVIAALRTGRPAEDHARLFEVGTGRQLGPDIGQPGLRGMAASKDGARLLLRSDRLVTVWQPSSGQKLCQRTLPGSLIDALSPDGKLVASAEPGKSQVEIWSAESGKLLHTVEHVARPSQLSFPSSDRLEVVGDRYRLWWIR
jgi:WD40 repeat protein